MRKHNKLIAVLASSVIFAISPLAISCGNKKQDQNNPYTPKEKNPNNKNNQSLIKGGVKYAALGDELTAGSKLNGDASIHNYYDKSTKKIHGLSFASYLANAIATLGDKQTYLESYNNYGLVNTTIDDWKYLLNLSERKSTNTTRNLQTNSALSKNSQKIQKLFNNFRPNNNQFTSFISQVKEANLLTLSLGFHDFISQEELGALFWLMMNSTNETKEQDKKQIEAIISKIVAKKAEIRTNYNSLLAQIRLLNKDANINLIGYYAPFLKYSRIFEKHFGTNYLTQIAEAINGTIKDVAKDNGVGYFNFNNQALIERNSQRLSYGFGEETPNLLGQKQLAQDVFMKMALSQSDYSKLIKSPLDSQSSQVFDFSKAASVIKGQIIGSITDANSLTFNKSYPFETDTINERQFKAAQKNRYSLNYTSLLKALFSSATNYSDEEIVSFALKIFNLLGIQTNDYPEISKTLQALIKENGNKEKLIAFVNALLDNKTLDKAFNKINEEFDKKLQNTSASISDLQNLVKQNLTSYSAFYEILKEFFQTPFIKDNSNKAFTKSLLKVISNSLVSNITLISKDKEILKDKEFKNSLDQIFEKIADLVTSDPSKYFTGSVNDFIRKVLLESKNEIKNLTLSAIKWMKNNANKFDLKAKLKELIGEDISEDALYYLTSLIHNLDKFSDVDKLLLLAVDSYLETFDENNHVTTKSKVLDRFLNKLFSPKLFKAESNEQHEVLFKLMSFMPSEEKDATRFKKGLKELTLWFIKKEDFLSPDNLIDLANEDFRKSVISFIKDILENKDDSLSTQGKELISEIANYLIDSTLDKDGGTHQLIGKLGESLFSGPIASLLTSLQISAQDLGGKSIEEFSKELYQAIFTSISKKELVTSVKSILKNIIENGKDYTFSSGLHEFISKILANAETNGLVDYVQKLFTSLAEDEQLWEKLYTVFWALTKKSGANITEENKAKIKTVIKKWFANLTKTSIFELLTKKITDISKKIDYSEIDDFQKWAKYYEKEMRDFVSLTKNPNIAKEIFDLFLAKEKDKEDSNLSVGELMEVMSLLFGNEANIDYILNSLNLPNLISQALKGIGLDGIQDPELKEQISQLINSLDKHLSNNWKEKYQPKVKELIKSLFGKADYFKNIKTINDLLEKIITNAKEPLSDLATEFTNSYLFDQSQLEGLIKYALKLVAKKHEKYFKLSDEEIQKLAKGFAETLGVIKNESIIKKLLDKSLDLLAENVKKHGLEVQKYDYNDIFKKLIEEIKPEDLVEKLLTAFLKDEENIKMIAKNTFTALNSKLGLKLTEDDIKYLTSFVKRFLKTLVAEEGKPTLKAIVSSIKDAILKAKIYENNAFKFENILKELKTLTGLLKSLDETKINKIVELLKTQGDAKDIGKELSTPFKLYVVLIPHLKSSDKANGVQLSDKWRGGDENGRKEFFKELDRVATQSLKAVSKTFADLNGEKDTILNDLSEGLRDILTNQLKSLDTKNLGDQFFGSDDIKKVIDKITNEQDSLKEIIKKVLEKGLFGGELKGEKLGEVISDFISKIKSEIGESITSLVKKLLEDNDLVDFVWNKLKDILVLENTDEQDKTFAIELIKELAKKMLDDEFFKTKVIKGMLTEVENGVKKFDMASGLSWLNETWKNIQNFFTFNDAFVLAKYIGDGDKPINGEKLVKLLNLILGKANFEKSPIYNLLRNINQDPDKSKRTNMQTLNRFINEGNSDSGGKDKNKNENDVNQSVDYLRIVDTFYKLLTSEFNKDENNKNPEFKVRSQTESYKALYRFVTLVNYSIFEAFGRETLTQDREKGFITLYKGTRAILWELQEGTNLKWIPYINSKFQGMQRYLTDAKIRNEFNNYYIKYESKWFFSSTYTYYEEENYTPDSIMYLINSSGYNEKEQDKLKPFKYKVTENGAENDISKKEYVLLTIKEGGYGKFMKLNNATSKSSYSGLDKVKEWV
ncbi:SGNH/GDSL hydrolase family protein [Metamycoplasma arthritidis]|uniref:Conserved hypothetical lipoprotein n=1 Tax=Metamycoplasma arthritidis (strain 158L3-1) TaxID=243272 RepID=B3PMQ4_META1|nr:SGNH/GDSL hydrolase family protein [Metamycoplasma arthritidis]ACF07306.1 conserved hypothetical lipoprotein [Metamycoplasma arthritidis 158L3-1]